MTAAELEELHKPSGNTLTAEIREAEFDVEVVDRDDSVPGVTVLTFRQYNHRMLPPWHPGAHVDVLVPGVGPRQYSLCGDPADRRHWRIAVLLEGESRGGSVAIHQDLKIGAVTRLRGPRNHFAFEPADRCVFVAGGIGITPMLPMIRQAAHEGRDRQLIYTGKRRDTMPLLPEVEQLGDLVIIWETEQQGRFDLTGTFAEPTPATVIYACGPASLLEAMEQATRHWPAKSLRVERFAARTLDAPVLQEPFEVELRESGLTLTVPPDRSILEVVEDAGIHVLSSCGEGTCGTCETSVLEGEPEHRDSVLDEDERAVNDCMMICVSRSCSKKLVLGL